MNSALSLTIGPLLYWWPRQAVLDLYAAVADGPAQTVVLGEVVCSRRNGMAEADWLALARELAEAGKTVVLATLALPTTEGELATVQRIATQDEFAVEAGDAAALRALAVAAVAQPQRPGFVIGPHLNVYSRAALAEHAAPGAARWVAPLELSLDAIAHVNPATDRVAGPVGAVASEVFGFGRMPLAFSARCFTARHHRLKKDDCALRCRDDADGLPLACGDGRPFLVLNGIQTQSATLQALLDEGPALRAAGVQHVRLSPCAGGFARVVELFDAVYNQGLDPHEARLEMATLGLGGELCNGYAHRRPGMEAFVA